MKKSISINQVFDIAIKKYTQELIVGVIFLLTYWPTFIWMWDRWFSRDSYYSHGILIPFVTIWLIWQRSEELVKIKRQESKWGLPLIVLGLVIRLVSSLFRVYFSSGFSLMIVFVGIILHYFGFAILRIIAFPIFFLFFMIPLPMVVIANISFKLKLFAAQIATVILNHMGILAIRDGSIIKMKDAHVVVDDVCSGLRSLISLTALGSICAYWMKSSLLKRSILFLSTIPIAIITNVCRVIILSFISEVWGTQYVTGLIHDATGFLVFGLAFVLLMAVGRLLE